MRLRSLLLAAGLVVAAAAPAAAHVDLQAAEPAPDATVATSPERVLLQFSGEVVPAADGLIVVGTDGERADDGDIQRPAPNQLAVGLRPSLPPGRYAVEWRILAPDGDTQEGGHVFTVAQQDTSSTTSGPTTTQAAPATPRTAAGDGGSDDDGVGWLPVVLGVVAVAAVGAGAAGIVGSRRRT
jgi:methionine-rich copper-binding protein CopC